MVTYNIGGKKHSKKEAVEKQKVHLVPEIVNTYELDGVVYYDCIKVDAVTNQKKSVTYIAEMYHKNFTPDVVDKTIKPLHTKGENPDKKTALQLAKF